LVQAVEHNAGLIARQPVYFEIHPKNNLATPPQAEFGKAALRWELHHWQSRFAEVLDNVVTGALAARMWAADVDYNRDLRRIVWRERDGRTIAWAEGYADPHDSECPWVMTWDRVPLKQVEGKRGWKHTRGLVGDDGFEPVERSAVANRSTESDSHEREPDPELVTVVKLWERAIWDTADLNRPMRMLKPEERYLQCGDEDLGMGCGWKGLPQYAEPEGLDEDTPCPECLGPTMLITAVQPTRLKYADGHRFTIFAPLQPESPIFVEGGWPFDLPTVPHLVFQPKPNPHKQTGNSLTSQNWTLQVGSNWLMRMALEQMRLAKPYHAMPVGWEDAEGEPWHFGPQQGLGLFWRGDGPFQAPQTIQGSGIPAGLPAVWGMVQGNFRQNMGSTDIGLSQQQSRDIPVGTIREIVFSAQVPVDHMIRRLRRALTPVMNVLLKLIGKTYTVGQWRELIGPDGVTEMLEVYGAELGDFDVSVTAEPDLSEMDQQELDKLLAFAASPPPVRRFIARLKHIPPGYVRQLEQDEQAWLMQQQEMAAMNPMNQPLRPGVPGANGGGAQRGAPQPQGVNGTTGLGSLPVAQQRRIGGATYGAVR